MKLTRLALLVVASFLICSSGASRSQIATGADFTRYKHFIVHPADEASFAELEVAKYFEEVGLHHVGRNEAVKFKEGECIEIRWKIRTSGPEGFVINLTVDDSALGKVLLSVQSSGWWGLEKHPDEKKAVEGVITELRKYFKVPTAKSDKI